MQPTSLRRTLVGLVLGAACGLSFAAPTYCSAPGAHAGGLDVTDVTYSVTGVAPFSAANDCYGVVSGNVNGAADVNGVFGSGFVYGDSTDAGSGTATLFGGSFTFTLSGPANGQKGGTYTLSATDNNGAANPNFPIGIDFIVALKASDRYALYFFDNAVFDGSGGGAWSIEFVNNGGKIPGLSHMMIFVREGNLPTTRLVPEPGALALAGAALGLLGIASGALRRRSPR